jgi:hypothetical protein
MNRINNLEELLMERRRIEVQIAEQKQGLIEELIDVKQKLEPFLNLLPVLNIFRKKEPNRSLLSTISSLGIDLVGQTYLAKSSWITKFLAPLIAKGISSSLLSKNKSQSPAREVS